MDIQIDPVGTHAWHCRFATKSMLRLSTRQKIAIAGIAYKCVHAGRALMGKGDKGIFTRGGFKWELDLAEGVDLSIYLLGKFELGLVSAYEKLIKPGQVVLDIGANIGAHTLHFARLVGPTGRVYAFEATEYGVQKLHRNLELNPQLKERIVVCHTLLTDGQTNEMPTEIYASWPVGGGVKSDSLHLGQKKDLGMVEKISLTEVLKRIQVEQIDFVKLDVDGNELPILQGGIDTLAKKKPKLVIELSPHSHDEHDATQFERLIELLGKQLGYHWTTLDGAKLPQDAKGLRAYIPHGGSINALAT